MANVSERLKERGIIIPVLPPPAAAYVPAVISGNLVYASGQTCTVEGKPVYKGKLGRDITLEEGYQAARMAALNCLGELQKVLGDINRVRRIVKVVGYVASAEGFGQQPKVLNGASELMEEIWGEAGKHARSVVGVTDLPGGAAVAIELIAEIE